MVVMPHSSEVWKKDVELCIRRGDKDELGPELAEEDGGQGSQHICLQVFYPKATQL